MGGVSDKSDNPGDKDTYNPLTGKTTEPKKGGLKSLMKGGGIIGAVTKPFRDKTEEINRKFYNEKVVPAGKSKAPDYETYMKDRLAGKTDAYGNPTSNTGGNDNNNQPILEPSIKPLYMDVTAPTNAEVTQAGSTTMSADEILLANKKKGRSQTILNQAQGLGSSTANTTKKTLGA